MPDAAYYRQKAKRRRALAAAEPNAELAKQLLSSARNYDVIAGILEMGGETDAPSPATGAVQQQPMQQQQSKAEDDKEGDK